jgi:hypothetical protein
MGDCCCVHGAAETAPGGGVDVGPSHRAREEGLDEGQPPDLAKNNLAAGAERLSQEGIRASYNQNKRCPRRQLFVRYIALDRLLRLQR